MGDVLKVNCATCHQGVNKPLGGYSMLKDNPALAEKPQARPTAPGPVVTAVTAVVPGVGAKVVGVAAPAETVAAIQAARADM
jgi:mono/diheme cytochrome c family protein